MSWSGFKKNVGRATTQVMMKTGHVEKTSDREYEVEERRYRTLEAASLRLQKEAKGYLDSLRAMTASQMRIAETIDAFYGEAGAKDGVSRSYKQAVEDLDAETVKALDGPYRCVPSDLVAFTDCAATVEEVEREWNFAAGRRRNFTKGFGGDGKGGVRDRRLMDYMYRTTVLDPINRFCAYFPDINECIKKRQHKMLDYDAMRSKVKKLTEKPDKDPGKLPRTEKETEMVSRPPFSMSPSTSTHNTLFRPTAQDLGLEELDLLVPSPSKVLERPEIQKLRRNELTPERRSSKNPEKVRSRITSWSGSARSHDSAASPRRISYGSPGRKIDADSVTSFNATEGIGIGPQKKKKKKPRSISRKPTPQRALRGPITAPYDTASFLTSHPAYANDRLSISNSTSSGTSTTPSSRPFSTSTGFFQPSELEDIMEPFMLEFTRKQADDLEQAKAAYEQLNEQLTNELPQLIDLRVPYLDPTFEALVKIQLRFCAEAYSRMAQVQQYLDASTRDQYASGDLDARVEDVLGQIRELSIAGTV